MADRVETLSALGQAGYVLMPLKPRTKVPRDAGWRTADYSSFNAQAWLARGGNVGIRLRPQDIVIDIDPRNGGTSSFERLADATVFDLDAMAPRVQTGGGGVHLFFTKPAGVDMVGKLPAYPGVDFKGEGGFVVAPGSVHPDTGRVYSVSPDSPPVAAVRPLPDSLVALLRRPPAPPRRGEGGKLSPEQLETLLGALDARDFGEGGRFHGRWESLMAAAHDATNGDGEDVWLDWCASDEAYGDDAREQNRYRWQSFTAGRAGGATVGTLAKYLIDAGRGDVLHEVLGAEAADDFPDDEVTEEARTASTAAMESTYAESLSWEEPKWLIEGFIPWGGLVQNYGVRKALKTFVTLDMALCVATGRPYHGHAVVRGKVTYVAAEGSKSRFRDRVTAWLRLNKVDPAELDGWWFQVNRPVNLTDKRAVDDFLKRLRDGTDRALIVFDTLSKNTGGVDEDTKGMKAAVNGANAVRFATGAAEILVHHEGKDPTKKGRGSTVLPGDVDLSLRTQRLGNGRCTVSVDEARDTDEGKTLAFELVEVIVGEINETSAAVRLSGEQVRKPKSSDDFALMEIVEVGTLASPKDLVDDTKEGMSRANVYKVVDRLRSAGLVAEGEPLRATRKGTELAMLMGATAPEEEADNE